MNLWSSDVRTSPERKQASCPHGSWCSSAVRSVRLRVHDIANVHTQQFFLCVARLKHCSPFSELQAHLAQFALRSCRALPLLSVGSETQRRPEPCPHRRAVFGLKERWWQCTWYSDGTAPNLGPLHRDHHAAASRGVHSITVCSLPRKATSLLLTLPCGAIGSPLLRARRRQCDGLVAWPPHTSDHLVDRLHHHGLRRLRMLPQLPLRNPLHSPNFENVAKAVFAVEQAALHSFASCVCLGAVFEEWLCPVPSTQGPCSVKLRGLPLQLVAAASHSEPVPLLQWSASVLPCSTRMARLSPASLWNNESRFGPHSCWCAVPFRPHCCSVVRCACVDDGDADPDVGFIHESMSSPASTQLIR